MVFQKTTLVGLPSLISVLATLQALSTYELSSVPACMNEHMSIMSAISERCIVTFFQELMHVHSID
jgi:hypothetical protein